MLSNASRDIVQMSVPQVLQPEDWGTRREGKEENETMNDVRLGGYPTICWW